uniref:Uncharacterized protein n=1 Tax=Anguilla anguilla TaxID=7936 RepID=A0A0E9WLR0_ANGAN
MSSNPFYEMSLDLLAFNTGKPTHREGSGMCQLPTHSRQPLSKMKSRKNFVFPIFK